VPRTSAHSLVNDVGTVQLLWLVQIAVVSVVVVVVVVGGGGGGGGGGGVGVVVVTVVVDLWKTVSSVLLPHPQRF